jgi:chorismate dehydratase
MFSYNTSRYLCTSMQDESVRYKIGVVDYLNTRPMMEAFRQGAMAEEIIWKPDYPSRVAESLINGETDLALIPVATIPLVPQAQLVSDFGIAASGPVASVCLFSRVPIEQITHLYLDYQSRTSVRLTEILLRKFWKINPVLLPAQPGYENNIIGSTAGLIIGDRALLVRNEYPFIYDLAEAWKSMTGLPFVFARWVANKPMDVGFLERFNQQLAIGLTTIEQWLPSIDFPAYDLRIYYTQNIHYLLDKNHQTGMDMFLSMI